MRSVTAVEIAKAIGVDPKRYRQALRNANFSWYVWGAPWTVIEGSQEHTQMMAVMDRLQGRSIVRSSKLRQVKAVSSRASSDEAYILDLCDDFLGLRSIRQHGFDFLRGDPGNSGHGKMLPVDAWYPEAELVIEYRERQHSESVKFFDRRETVSGMGRGEQRKRYDQRRRDILPAHAITLIEFDYFEFRHNANRKLIRCEEDRTIVTQKLSRFTA